MATIRERTRKDGSKRYHVQVRRKGHPTETASFRTRSQAKRWATNIEAAMEEGRHFQSGESRKHTVAEMLDRYEREGLRDQKDVKSPKRYVKYWRERLGRYLLADISQALLIQERERLLSGSAATDKGKTNRSPATVNRHFSTLSHAFSLAVQDWQWLSDSPMRNVKKLKEPKGRVRFLSDSECAQLLEKCKASSQPFLYAVVAMAVATGARQGEIMNLTWQDVDLERRVAIAQETKNGERRRLPLSEHICDVLRAMRKVRRIDTHLLFPSKKGDKPISLRNAWLKVIRECELENFRFHDLRHTAASYLAMNGASLAEIAEILGHKTLDMVKRYAHLCESHTASVVDSMNRQVFGDN